MPDHPKTFGLYEAFAVECNESLTQNRIHHDLLIARDDEHAQILAEERAGGMLAVTVTRLMDVVPRRG